AGRRVVRAGVALLVRAEEAGPVVRSVQVEAETLAKRNRFYRQLGDFVTANTPADAIVLLDALPRFNPSGSALAWYAERTVLQYSPWTVGSGLVRQAARPVFGLRLRGAAEPDAASAGEDDPADDDRLADGPAFTRLAEWSGTEGDAVLYRFTAGGSAAIVGSAPVHHGLHHEARALARLLEVAPEVFAQHPEGEDLHARGDEQDEHERRPALDREAAGEPQVEDEARVEDREHEHHEAGHGNEPERQVGEGPQPGPEGH